MKNKTLKIIVPLVGFIITALLIIWLILSLCTDICYFDISLKDWFTIFFGFVAVFFFSYYLTNIRLNYEKKLDTYEQILIKMQNKLKEDPAHLFSKSMSVDHADKNLSFYSKDILLYFRALNNYFNLISKYQGDLKIADDLKFIEEHLDTYKFELTENISNYETIKSKRSIVQKEIDLIDNKLDEIRLKLH